MYAVLSDNKEWVLIFHGDSEVPEEMPLGDFVAIYGDEALPDGADCDEPEMEISSRIYWNEALDLVNTWSNYQAKKKLYINATHKETRFKVQHVVDNHFHSLYKLAKLRDDLSDDVDFKLESFEDICHCFGVEPVSRNWLYDHLKRGKDYESIRNKIRRRMDKPAQSLSKL